MGQEAFQLQSRPTDRSGLTPAEGYKVERGFLTPDGVMYDVGFEGHDWFADAWGVTQDNLYRQKWLKLSGNEWFGDDYLDRVTYVTQKQLDYIFEWHQANRRSYQAEKYRVR
jgi:hypothetical protein